MPTYLPETLGVSHSQAVAEAYASATAGEPLAVTLEIWHPLWTIPIRVVSDLRDLTATLESTAPRNASTAVLFSAVPFRYTRAEQSADPANNGAPSAMQLEIDNVSGEITEALLLAKESNEPLTIIEREYLRSDTTAPHVLPVTTATLSNVSVGVDVARASVSFGNLTNRKFPTLTYTAERFPMLAA